MKIILTLSFITICITASAQNRNYTTRNAHSHNDYEQQQPFWAAYNKEFGSVEADIYLLNDSLFVAHDTIELRNRRTLTKYYLDPIESCIKKNNGFIYSDTSKLLQVLIDIKTDSIHTLNAFIQTLQKYPDLINNKTISWVISGNRPDEKLFTTYPSFIYFDGEISKDYSSQALTKIKMMSASFRNYSLWKGENNFPDSARLSVQNAINKMHHLNKPVRFWASPDNINTWKQFMNLGVDYINTDKIAGFAGFIKIINSGR
ncbi:MAG: phosphatidylinositol-specific phospholipase C/glycerophosphodiester phosphodiesterase family protein [Ferruginibacter sp.]